uniref:acyl-CoA dehydrogenase C-terminal domain-containing protein n=1 Tax=Paraburkholderia sp. C35 TaxID=2126993 RepID=UPI00195070CE
AGSVPYLKLAGIVLGGWQMARALLAAQQKLNDDASFYGAKIATAQFFAEHVLPQAVALEASITSAKGGEGILALSEDQF